LAYAVDSLYVPRFEHHPEAVNFPFLGEVSHLHIQRSGKAELGYSWSEINDESIQLVP